MPGEVLVSVEGVSKKFCRKLGASLAYGLRDMTSELLGIRRDHGTLRPHEFWAVDDVSFELRRGECLGLIGHNGAGKTTLLKMLNGLIKPDRGRITMRGKIGALIALGAGFNPILSGRENIYVNASVLGLGKREIDARFDEIVDFADVREAIDAPVQSYSSGMAVRLGFAIASTVRPDVLLVDEVLAVGDAGFRVRCYNRIRELMHHSAIVLVSHSMFDIARVCNGVLVMASGKQVFAGGVAEGVATYETLSVRSDLAGGAPVMHLDPSVESVAVEEFSVQSGGLETSCRVIIRVACKMALGPVRVRLIFNEEIGISAPVAEWDSHFHDWSSELREGENELEISLSGIRLRSGSYQIATVLTGPSNIGYFALVEDAARVRIANECIAGAYYRL